MSVTSHIAFSSAKARNISPLRFGKKIKLFIYFYKVFFVKIHALFGHHVRNAFAHRHLRVDADGKKMLQMAIRYAFDMLQAEKVTLGVFENNPSAYYCYKAAGFKKIETEKKIVFEILGEQWKCIEMEVNKV